MIFFLLFFIILIGVSIISLCDLLNFNTLKKIFIVLEYAEEFSSGSSPQVTEHVFTSKRKMEQYIELWNKFESKNKEKSATEPNTYYGIKWTYWLEHSERIVNEIPEYLLKVKNENK